MQRLTLTLLLTLGVCAVVGAQNAPAKPHAAGKKTDKKTQADAFAARFAANAYQPGQVRIKDIADVQGVRGNQLIGYGLVVGLEGTGDGQTSLFTGQSVLNMLRKFGITLNVSPQQFQVKNVAAVMVTADLPPFVKSGSKIDVTVSSLGDAKSLQGGTLLQTPLRAGNGDTYAVAQGPISIGGFNFSAGGSSIQKNHVAAGRIPRGAYVEQEVPSTILDAGRIEIILRDPDFTTASRAAIAIRKALPGIAAQAIDPATIAVNVPPDKADDLINFIAHVEGVSVTPDVPARIIVNERTGTVVMGGNVRLAPGAVSHGSISIRIENTPVIVPPAPFNPNPGQVVDLKNTTATERTMKLAPIPSTTTVDQLVRALNALGVTPRDLISILQGMQSAGMIAAEIEVQ